MPPTKNIPASITNQGHHHACASAGGIPNADARAVRIAEKNAPMP
jgi:hypothetical protein